MHPKFEELWYQSGLTAQGCWDSLDDYDRAAVERLASLIVDDVIKLLQQEWYQLNNAVLPKDESTRDMVLRVGRKGEVVQLINKVKKHYGVQ